MHAYHDGLVDFHPDQILHDGCGECEERGENVAFAIGALDTGNFERAWKRACDWSRPIGSDIHVSDVERPLLRVLWAIQVQLERRSVRLGDCPGVTPMSLTRSL
ncbi:MAG TPA: hypothetical protein VIJ31_12105 [Acidothermaceae bacterium]